MFMNKKRFGFIMETKVYQFVKVCKTKNIEIDQETHDFPLKYHYALFKIMFLHTADVCNMQFVFY